MSGSLLFQPEAYQLHAAAEIQLDSVLSVINERGPKSLQVIGHTDNRGEASYNQKLSQKRAKSVFDLLETKINDPTITLSWEGKGEEIPIIAKTNASNRKLNRRGELILTFDE